ncbi:MAG TPA: Crp/Fnr family transcriptional regulator [Allosphingosinicella sp.]|jgi:CRP-like cAMP-binding protein|nr:Crp/Fnr family transcriptional regulator [Allosphingosinicella sp.]
MDVRSHPPLQLLVRKLETHLHLDEEDRQAILNLPYRQRSRDAQSYLVREGTRPEHCAVLLSGYAFRQKLTGEGGRQILSIHIPGDAVDFQNMFLDEADHNVQMLTRGEVAEIPRQPLEELALSRPSLGRAILVATLVEASVFREWTLNVGRRNSRSRIAHLLCEFAVRLQARGLQPDGAYELPMTQEQLADATGLTSVHVNRVLRALQSEGLIERERRAIRFPDWQRMRDAGDFSARYLHIRDGVAEAMRIS